MKKVLITGTFDPITKGHMSIIRKCSEIFDEVVVCIFVNNEKVPMFSLETRIAMIKASCKNIGNVTVDHSDGMVANYTRMNNIEYIARGIRNADDTSYEILMADYNRKLNHRLKTLFFPCDIELRDLSSTAVRKAITFGDDYSAYVEASCVEIIRKTKIVNGTET